MFSLSRSTVARSSRAGYGILVVLGLILVAYVLIFYAGPRVIDHSKPPELSSQVLHPTALRLHALTAALALLAGLVQWGPRGRRLPLGWHRRLGYGYFFAVLISGLAGLWLAPFSEGGLVAHFGFGALAVLWLTTTIWGVRAAIRGDVAGHRRAMLRSLALTCAGITLRLQLPVGGLIGWGFAAFYPWVAWTCWVPNLVFAEFLLRRK